MNGIYIITAVHNRRDITFRFVQMLKKQTIQPIHLIIVDDGSTDGTSEMVRDEMAESTILYGNGNLWWGGSLHLAYKWVTQKLADNDVIVITNDDNFFENDFFEKMKHKIETYPNTLVVGCGYNIRTGKQEDGVIIYDYKQVKTTNTYSVNQQGNCSSTRCVGLHVSDFKKIGGFHPVLLPHYLSDIEWMLRASKKGYTIQSFENLNYMFDGYESGDTIEKKKGMSLKTLFSKHTNANPIYKATFMILTTPIQYLPVALIKRLKHFVNKKK